MPAVTDIGCGVVTQIAHLRQIAYHVAAIKQVARSAGLSREQAIAIAYRCKAIGEVLSPYLQLALPFSPTCPTCGAPVSARRY